MKVKILICLLCFSFLNIKCSPVLSRIGYEEPENAKSPDCSIIIKEDLDIDQSIGVVLGTLNIADTRFRTKCSEKAVIHILKKEACNLGADIINIREIDRPGGFGSCFRCTADFIKLNEPINKNSISSLSKYNDEKIEQRDQKDRIKMFIIYIGSFTAVFIAAVIIGNNY